MRRIKDLPWLKTLYGIAAAVVIGAGGGAAVAAILQAYWSGPFSPFDGAWLGTAFTVPIGATIGFAASSYRRAKPYSSDATAR